MTYKDFGRLLATLETQIKEAKAFIETGIDAYVFISNRFAKADESDDVLLKNMDYSYFYTCGPEPMLKAIYDKSASEGEFSFEERMGCGFGACMGCTCETKYKYKRICRDGPVLTKEEIIW